VGKSIVRASNSIDISIYMLNLDCEGIMQKITFVDTPGFDTENDRKIQNSIIEYITDQFDSLLKEESKIRRDPKHADTRVHCLLYFIPSTGNGLTHRDLCFLSRVNNLVNIIPVISKADGLTTIETESLKNIVRDQLRFYNIKTFNLENEEFLSQSILDLKLNSVVPFTIINPEEYSIDRLRMHACGPIEVDNPSNNDSSIIREIILSSHLDTLIEVTSSEIYENYRMEVLESMTDQ